MTTGSMTSSDSHSRSRHPDRRDLVGDGRAPYVLCIALAVSVALAAGFTVAFPSLLRGVAVSNGNLRGTAVALLVVGLPVLLVAAVLDGTGLVTNPVYVQDLAIWLPLLATAAVACWRRDRWGLLITAAMLAHSSGVSTRWSSRP